MSNYLSHPGAFERQASRGFLSLQSAELKTLIKAVAGYVSTKTNIGLIQVMDAWWAWKKNNPKEFAERGIHLAIQFQVELKDASRRFNLELTEEDQDDDWEAPAIPEARQVVRNKLGNPVVTL